MMKSSIEATQYSVDKIFSNDFIFNVPRYQRPYAWTTKHAGELLDDLVSFIGDETNVKQLSPYFMGSIVLIEESEKPNVSVVDGQQRLATLTILLAVLRSLLDLKLASKLTPYLYEEGDIFLGTVNNYRVNLRPQDASFFRDYIQEEGGIQKLKDLDSGKLTTDGQKNIYKNACYFSTYLSGYSSDRLVHLVSAIVTKCFLVVVSTSDMDSAYRIFSILNGRGLDITLTDILKSDLLSTVHSSLEEIYTDKWEEIEEQLGRERFEALFSHIRMIYRKTKLRGTVLGEIREYFFPKKNSGHVSPIKTSEQFIDTIAIPYADAFDNIINTSYPSIEIAEAEKINIIFKWLNRIDNADWLPPAILYLARNTNNPSALVRFFTDLERLSAGLMILRTNINSRIDRYAQLLNAIEHNADLYAADSPLQLTSTECTDIFSLLNGDLYLMSEVRLYVLLRLDEAISDNSVIHKHGTITIEHVLPQNPSLDSIWLNLFPDPSQRLKYVHTLGNLALLSKKKNSMAQNYDFDKKKDKYFKTKGVTLFALTTQVISHNQWNSEVIERRQRELTSKLKELWRL